MPPPPVHNPERLVNAKSIRALSWGMTEISCVGSLQFTCPCGGKAIGLIAACFGVPTCTA